MKFLGNDGRRKTAKVLLQSKNNIYCSYNTTYVYVRVQLVIFFVCRLTRSCRRKCIPPKYHDGELSKGEVICLSKFMDVQERAGKKLTAMFAQQ